MNKENQPKKALIQSLERALDILELIGSAKEPVRSIDIADRLGLKANTANNLLRVLYQRRYLNQDINRGYILGTKCWELGSMADRWSILRDIAAPVMKELSVSSGDLTFLGVLDKFNLVCLEQFTGSGAITITDKYVCTDKLHYSASGKVLLASLSDSEIDNYLSNLKVESLTPGGISDVTKLQKQLKKVKKTGFAICKDEAFEGISAVGVPVYSHDGNIIASLAQNFPTYFLDTGKINIAERITLLKKSSDMISRNIKKI